MNCLNKHRQLVHSNVEYIDCDQCDLKIKTLAGLRKHKLVKHYRHKLLCDKVKN